MKRALVNPNLLDRSARKTATRLASSGFYAPFYSGRRSRFRRGSGVVRDSFISFIRDPLSLLCRCNDDPILLQITFSYHLLPFPKQAAHRHWIFLFPFPILSGLKVKMARSLASIYLYTYITQKDTRNGMQLHYTSRRADVPDDVDAETAAKEALRRWHCAKGGRELRLS